MKKDTQVPEMSFTTSTPNAESPNDRSFVIKNHPFISSVAVDHLSSPNKNHISVLGPVRFSTNPLPESELEAGVQKSLSALNNSGIKAVAQEEHTSISNRKYYIITIDNQNQLPEAMQALGFDWQVQKDIAEELRKVAGQQGTDWQTRTGDRTPRRIE